MLHRSPLCPAFLALLVATPCLAQTSPAKAPQTIVIEGRVVDMRGEGVPAANVQVVTWDAPDTALARTVADGDGYFRLGKVPPERSLRVHAQADGYCVGVAIAAGGATRRTVTIDMQHAVAVRGILRNGKGVPVSGAIVRAAPVGRSLDYVHCDARTDAEGKFLLPAVPMAPVGFGAWVDGEGLASSTQHVAAECEIALAPNEEKTTGLEIAITGLPAGAPMRFILLPYRSRGLAYLPPPHDRPQVDAEGRWSLAPAPDCDYTIYATAEAFAFAPSQVEVKAGQGPHKIQFTATPRGDATLAYKAIVRGPDDKPVPGLPFAMRAANSNNVAEATSGDDGTLAFASPLAKGSDAVIYTTHEAWVVDQKKVGERVAVDRHSLVWHETVVDPSQVLELRVVPACRVHGRLLLADGRPAAMVSVQLEESSASRWPRWMPMSWARTDRDGGFRFVGCHHLPDDARVHVEDKVGSYTSEPFPLAKAGDEQRLGDLRLAPPACVEGVVRDAGQRPVPGLRVWLRDWDLGKNSQVSGSVTETLTDRDGRYRFLGVPIGGAWLQLLPGVDERSPSGKAVEPFEVEAGKTYTFDLQTPAK